MSYFVLNFYTTKYLKVDEEEFGKWELMTEGFMPGYGVFLVSCLPPHFRPPPLP